MATGRRTLATRVATCAGVALLLVVLLLTSAHLRVAEARLAAPVLQLVTGHPARPIPGTPIVVAGLNTHWVVGLEVSPMCSAAILFIPILVAAAVVACSSQTRPVQLAVALAACAALLLATNTARIAAIALCIQHLGIGRGYGLAHDTLGTLISFAGVGLALLAFVFLVTRSRKRPVDAEPPHHA